MVEQALFAKGKTEEEERNDVRINADARRVRYLLRDILDKTD